MFYFQAKQSGEPVRNSFFDYAIGPYDAKTVRDVAKTMSVFTVFIPLPVFWSLYDQHASRWVYQADKMNRDVFGWFTLEPDQIPVLNPICILTMIPLFNRVIYPSLEKRGIILKPLEHRMAIGMGLTALAFILSGTLDAVVDSNPRYTVYWMWQFPQYIVLGAGEIMVSVTGLEFAYSQAPKTMKSVVMSGWLMTTAVGNLLVILIATIDIVASEYGLQLLFFANMMLVFILIFFWIINGFNYKAAFDDYSDEEDVVGGSGIGGAGVGEIHLSDDEFDDGSGGVSIKMQISGSEKVNSSFDTNEFDSPNSYGSLGY